MAFEFLDQGNAAQCAAFKLAHPDSQKTGACPPEKIEFVPAKLVDQFAIGIDERKHVEGQLQGGQSGASLGHAGQVMVNYRSCQTPVVN